MVCMLPRMIGQSYEINTIVDLFCKNGFFRAISHQRRNPRYEMAGEIQINQIIFNA